MGVDSTATDAAVPNSVVRMASVGKEAKDLFRGVLEDVLVLIVLSVDLEEAKERMEVEDFRRRWGYSGEASRNNNNNSCAGGGSYNAGKKKQM